MSSFSYRMDILQGCFKGRVDVVRTLMKVGADALLNSTYTLQSIFLLLVIECAILLHRTGFQHSCWHLRMAINPSFTSCLVQVLILTILLMMARLLALFFAAQHGQKEVIRALIRQASDIDMVTKDGQTIESIAKL